jgi:molybdenum cofactor cytidylyltransferase
LNPIVVVTGANAELVAQALKGLDVIQTHNANWRTGQSTSVRAGVRVLPDHVEASLFLLADMPLVPPELVRALVRRHQTTLSGLVAPKAGGRRANPVLFDRSTFEALLELDGDQGGRTLFNHFQVEWVDWDEEILLDIDTDRDLEKLKALE